MKKVYFLSDAHLGSRALKGHDRERLLVRFLDQLKEDASAIYLLGDMFDFWYEYKLVIPKGYTRFLGKLAELTDNGIPVHFFIGNHDIWCGDYLEKECGLIIHREPIITTLLGQKFYLAHGDGLGDPDKKFQLLRALFHNTLLQKLFSTIHPRWSIDLGLAWAKKSRMKRKDGKSPVFLGENKDLLVIYSKQYLQKDPSVNFFIYGHEHILLDLPLSKSARIIVLGDWIQYFSYAVFDGQSLQLKQYTENVTSKETK